VEALRDLFERRAAARDFQRWPHRLRRIGVVPGIELLEGGDLVLLWWRVGGGPQPRIDMPRGLLAVTDCDRDGALGGHHVAAREDARTTGHHVGTDLNHAVLALKSRHPAQQRE